MKLSSVKFLYGIDLISDKNMEVKSLLHLDWDNTEIYILRNIVKVLVITHKSVDV